MRVLVYRALGLGDFLTAVPAYRAIAAGHPHHEVVLAAPEALRPLAGLTGAIDTFLPTKELAPLCWPGSPPEVAVNLHGCGPQSHLLLQGMGAERLIAFERPELGISGPAWVSEEHDVARWCRLVEESGLSTDRSALGLSVPSGEPVVRDATVLHPGAAAVARRWPAERFAELAIALESAGHRIVVTGVAAELALAREVAQCAGLPNDRVLAGCLDLGALAAVVAAARLVVCGDTGVAHLATAYGCRSVLLFGAMSPELWGPPSSRPQHHVLWHRAAVGRQAVRGRPHPALLDIGVPEVTAAALALDALGTDRPGSYGRSSLGVSWPVTEPSAI